ncbi:MAG: hypothetical protein WD876_00935 [Candidatus Pacearchaeota archaeon]
MAQRYIYLPDDLNEKLKKEENVSRLIQRLLFDFYKYNTTDLEEIGQKIKALNEKKELGADELNSEIKKLQIIQDRVKAEERTEQEFKNKKEQKEQSFKDNFFKNFKDLTNKDSTEELFKEFKNRWEQQEKDFNIFVFCDEHAK